MDKVNESYIIMKMIFKFSATIITFFISLCSYALCLAQTNQQLVEIAKEAFKAKNQNHEGLSREETFEKVFEDAFKGIGAEKRTNALAHYLYDIDVSYPEWSMNARIAMGAIDLLAADSDFISDWSYLREMLANEKNPRKFYLLSKLAYMAKPPDNDFVAASSHMLFEDGMVAKKEGEYTKPYYHDVSLYAYLAIVANLRSLDAEFVPPSEELPHEEQAMILATWLKANWPGCEKIEIPDNPEKEKDTAGNSSMDTRERARKPPAIDFTPNVAENHDLRYFLGVVGTLVFLAGTWFGLRRMKSR